MGVADVVTVVVASVAALSAYASQRAAARASTLNTTTTSRVDMEKEAYDRARKFDTETIERQDAELLELREKNEELQNMIDVARGEARAARAEVRMLRSDNDDLRRRIQHLESTIN